MIKSYLKDKENYLVFMNKATKGIKKEKGKKTRRHEVENALGY